MRSTWPRHTTVLFTRLSRHKKRNRTSNTFRRQLRQSQCHIRAPFHPPRSTRPARRTHRRRRHTHNLLRRVYRVGRAMSSRRATWELHGTRPRRPMPREATGETPGMPHRRRRSRRPGRRCCMAYIHRLRSICRMDPCVERGGAGFKGVCAQRESGSLTFLQMPWARSRPSLLRVFIQVTAHQ